MISFLSQDKIRVSANKPARGLSRPSSKKLSAGSTDFSSTALAGNPNRPMQLGPDHDSHLYTDLDFHTPAPFHTHAPLTFPSTATLMKKKLKARKSKLNNGTPTLLTTGSKITKQ